MWIRQGRVELPVLLKSRSIATIAKPDRSDAQQLALASDRLGLKVGTMMIAGDLRLIGSLIIEQVVSGSAAVMERGGPAPACGMAGLEVVAEYIDEYLDGANSRVQEPKEVGRSKTGLNRASSRYNPMNGKNYLRLSG